MRLLSLVLFLFLNPFLLLSQDSRNIRLLSNWNDLNIPENRGGARYNEVWAFGWEGREYAVIGSTYGSHICQVHPGGAFEELARIPGNQQGKTIIHRDFDFFEGYLYAVCDQGESKLQVIDLRELPEKAEVVFESDEFFSTAHNIFIDQYKAKAYVSGPSGHAMSVLDIRIPENPSLLSHFDDLSYVHDVYVRNDTAYLHGANQGFSVWNFEDASNPLILGSLDAYPEQGYNHSGWLSADGEHYVFIDETVGSRVKLCDVTNLEDIKVLDLFGSEGFSTTSAHNVMIRGNLIYVSYYASGLWVFDYSDPDFVKEKAFYDTHPENDDGFNGAWGVHSLLPSGKIIISDRQRGLFSFALDEKTYMDEDGPQIYPNPGGPTFRLSLDKFEFEKLQCSVYNSSGQLIQEVNTRNDASSSWLEIELQNQMKGVYNIRLMLDDESYELKYLFVLD